MIARSLAVASCAAAFAACAAPELVAGKAPLHLPPPPAPGVAHAEGVFTGTAGIRLFEQSWRPAPESGIVPKAVVVIVHGLKDHSSRYAPLAEQLVARGYAAYAFDLRGHGYSEGRRVWVDWFDQYVSDLDAFVKAVAAREPGRPVFVFGHSMGGAIVATYALTRQPPIRGIVLSAAALKVTSDVTPFLTRIVKWLGRSNPRIAVLKLPNKNFSSDPRAVEAMARDPVIYQGAGPARTAAELLAAIERIQQSMDRLALPFLVLHGTADVVTNPDGSKELFRRAASRDKTIKIYAGYYHDLLHEPGGAKVAADILDWLDARVTATGNQGGQGSARNLSRAALASIGPP
ncbi:MAG TPA: alpha/beta hydrolase [Polyangia bacterium]|nr:alpha/beta hydrolase [Polyangia bacterium]